MYKRQVNDKGYSIGRTRLDEVEVAPGIIVSGYADTSYRFIRGERAKKSRVYVGPKDWNLMEDLTNRTSRPHLEWGKIVRKQVLPFLGIESGARWSQYAGCSCPCSPGFILDGHIEKHGPKLRMLPGPGDPYGLWTLDVMVDYALLGGSPVVEGNDAERAARLANIMADPTLPFGQAVAV